jgi:hypothetical protein
MNGVRKITQAETSWELTRLIESGLNPDRALEFGKLPKWTWPYGRGLKESAAMISACIGVQRRFSSLSAPISRERVKSQVGREQRLGLAAAWGRIPISISVVDRPARRSRPIRLYDVAVSSRIV